MRRIKLIFVVNGHTYTAAHRLPLLNASQKADFDVQVIAPLESPAFEVFADSGYQVHGVQLTRRGMGPWHEISAIRGLIALYRDLRPDIVHHATIKPVLYGSIAARIGKVPVVVNAITGLGYVYTAAGLRVRLVRPLVNVLYRLALGHRNQKVIFQNADDREMLESAGVLGREESVLIRGSGVDVARFDRADEDWESKIVILPGRMLWDKGVGEFVEAARHVKVRFPEARFCLVGGLDEGNPSAIPKERLIAWVNEGAVEWWGEIKDMREVYHKANIVVLPSYREGLPKVLLEASASCRAVVTTDAPGCRDAVKDGETGYIVPIRNTDVLAERICALLGDTQLRARMGQAGRAMVVDNFSTDKVVKATLSLYKKLISNVNTKSEVAS